MRSHGSEQGKLFVKEQGEGSVTGPVVAVYARANAYVPSAVWSSRMEYGSRSEPIDQVHHRS